jgi:hypothetical protein
MALPDTNVFHIPHFILSMAPAHIPLLSAMNPSPDIKLKTINLRMTLFFSFFAEVDRVFWRNRHSGLR